MKVVVLSPNINVLFSPDQVAQLKSLGNTVLVDKIKPLEEVTELFDEEEKIVAIDPDFCEWKVPNEVLDKIPNLKAVCLQTTSFSWVDIKHLAEKNIPVTNLRGFSAQSVAEWAVMMAINLARRVPLLIKDGWKADYTKHQGMELRGKTAGIIGLGNIGTKIAEICEGFGMKVIYWSKSSKNPKYEYAELMQVMGGADFVFPAVANNEETRGMITDEMVNNMKPTASFISVVHQVYNHDLLVSKVKDGALWGYGFETPNPEFNNFEGNVWAGSELAWDTKESFSKNAAQWLESIQKAVQGNYETRVN